MKVTRLKYTPPVEIEMTTEEALLLKELVGKININYLKMMAVKDVTEIYTMADTLYCALDRVVE